MGPLYNVNNQQTIVYPKNLDVKTEGASSAPKEINHIDSIYFVHPDFYNMESNNTLTLLSHYKTYQQSRENTCAPAATLTVLNYLGATNYTEMELAKGMNTQPYPIGTNTQDMVNYLEKEGWTIDSSVKHKVKKGLEFPEFTNFKNFTLKNLKEGKPILLENVEWGGHWRVLIGYDTMGTDSLLDDVLILADPYDTSDHYQDGYAINNAFRFYSMWFDHSMLPKDQQNQQWIVINPKSK